MSQAQLDRIEAKLDKIIEWNERPAVTFDAERFIEQMREADKRSKESLDEAMKTLKVRFGGADYEKINEGISSHARTMPSVEPQERQLLPKKQSEPFSIIKRVEYFGFYSQGGMKPSKTVKYYLFGFILIYSNTERVKEFKNPSEEVK